MLIDRSNFSITHFIVQDHKDLYKIPISKIRFSTEKNYFIIRSNISTLIPIKSPQDNISIYQVQTSSLHALTLRGLDKTLGKISSFTIDPIKLKIDFMNAKIHLKRKLYLMIVPVKEINYIAWNERICALKLNAETIYNQYLFPKLSQFPDIFSNKSNNFNESPSYLSPNTLSTIKEFRQW